MKYLKSILTAIWNWLTADDMLDDHSTTTTTTQPQLLDISGYEAYRLAVTECLPSQWQAAYADKNITDFIPHWIVQCYLNQWTPQACAHPLLERFPLIPPGDKQ